MSQIRVRTGDTFKSGDTLALLKSEEFTANWLKAQAQLRKTRADYQRVLELFNQQVATAEQMDGIAALFQIALADSQIARYYLDHSMIIAEADGSVQNRMLEPGTTVSAGQPLLVVSYLNQPWRLVCSVSDRERLAIQLQDPAEITFSALTNQEIHGYVSNLAGSPDRASGLYQVHVSLDNPQPDLVAGLFARVLVRTKQSQLVQSIPISAVVEGNGKQAFVYCYNRKQSTVSKQMVVMKDIENASMLIEPVFLPGEQIVIAGSRDLYEGAPVFATNPAGEVQ